MITPPSPQGGMDRELIQEACYALDMVATSLRGAMDGGTQGPWYSDADLVYLMSEVRGELLRVGKVIDDAIRTATNT